MSIQIGLIGAGNRIHEGAYRNVDAIELTAVCDADEDRAKTVADEFEVDYWTDFEPFVEEAQIDAVDISLPHNLHHPAARAALDAHKHVLVEKPFTISMHEANELVELAADRDLRLMVGQQQRFAPHLRAAKRELESGTAGPIHHARVDGIQNLRDYATPPHWLYDGDLAGGGGVISVLIHKLDLLRYYIGEPERVCALGKTVDPAFEDAEDYCVGVLQFENGTIADLFSCYSAADPPYSESFWLFGEDAVLKSLPEEGAYSSDTVRMSRRVDGETTGFTDLEPAKNLPSDDPTTNEFAHFAECIMEEREPLTSGRDNLGTLATVFALYESLENDGEWIDVADVREEDR